MNETVARRWHEVVGDHAAGELAEFVAAYGAKGRHYHNLDHVAAMLDLSAEYAAELTNRDAIDLSILYHDAVYEPTRRDNEERSAALARDRLTALGRPAPEIDKVARYIEATKHVGAEPTADSDLDYLLDFDLSILGAPPDVYRAYASAIRQEYSTYPYLLYRPGRAKVLSAFLAQPRLYRVPKLAARWEAQARANLADELASLS